MGRRSGALRKFGDYYLFIYLFGLGGGGKLFKCERELTVDFLVLGG